MKAYKVEFWVGVPDGEELEVVIERTYPRGLVDWLLQDFTVTEIPTEGDTKQ
jgi:hypothetical protein